MARKNRRISVQAESNGDNSGQAVAANAQEPYQIAVLLEENGDSPFERWRNGLRDSMARLRIDARLARITQGGNFGDHRERIAGAISELRIDYGPGYRIYYVLHGNTIVIVVGGGVKDSQPKDIETIQTFWERRKSDVERYTRGLAG